MPVSVCLYVRPPAVGVGVQGKGRVQGVWGPEKVEVQGVGSPVGRFAGGWG